MAYKKYIPHDNASKRNETYRLIIKDIAFGGDGVAHLPDGKVCFIPDVLPDEEVEVKITDDRKNFAYAKLIEVHTPSSFRKDSECLHSNTCGGCQYWHTSYDYELQLKTKQLKDLLERMANLQPTIQLVPSKKNKEYRRSSTFHKDDQKKLGFFSRDKQDLVDIKDCPILDPSLNKLFQDKNEEVMRFNSRNIALKTDGENLSTPRRPLRLTYQYANHSIFYDVNCFFQANHDVLTQLIDQIRKHIKRTDVLFDLYSGVGVFAIALSDLYSKVIALEHARSSVSFAQFNTQDIKHIEVFKGKVENRFSRVYKKHRKSMSTILLNPPRSGVSPDVINDILQEKNIKQIVYCSCEPSTLARDLKKLTMNKDFDITNVILLDMFPRTKHFETLVFLEKVEKSL
ncbi:hypothetical protein AB834_06115 [PVC group bacterium (ex Bugula neritina AB1)]|nr:hypothetical protein AB834_06115 [PVC group bacterium (ex Bugula neritina AB1)]